MPDSTATAAQGATLRQRARGRDRPSTAAATTTAATAVRGSSPKITLSEWLHVFRPQRIASLALASAAAVLYRQTNVVWIAFAVALGALRTIDATRPGSLRAGGGMANPVACVWHLFLNAPSLMIVFAGPIAVAVGFIGFVFWNGGIVVGDRSNHVAGIHIPQLFYFASACLAGIAPRLLPLARSRELHHTSKPTTLPAFLALVAACLWAVSRFSIVHPFLLADNRHFSFYVARYLLRGSEWVKYAATPVYAAALLVLWRFAGTVRVPLFRELWFICAAAVLVPATLIEFRYFTVPFVLLYAYAQPPPLRVSLLLGALFFVTHAVVMYLFLARPFSWPDGSVQRFMY
mmetsp:Transcript_30438/g.99382  ORF Transcript_30438/g.99382 Transcript_30438/m.99382 type:complete len:347 (+) Transcript_30438:413-1453(+)